MQPSHRPTPTISRRQALTLLASTPLALVASACLGSDDTPATLVVNGTVVTGPSADGATAEAGAPTTATAVPFTPTPPISDLIPDVLTGFAYPIADACLPSRDEVMPNAPRTYRNGFHEGVDFYNGDVCTEISRDLPVLAMYDGVVVRALHDYVDITPDVVATLTARTADQGFTDPEALDIYRGRQVWIDHGNGIVSRYCHLESIDLAVAVGVAVRQGDLLGGVGDSGTPESITDPGVELHLHAEVRIGESFLGDGLDPVTVRALYEQLFTPPPAE
ncbi:MAG: M23 family peptidase [Chloroflexi bacterium]|nr:M23 family metallopeptidase [Chloroflexota bacterium]MDA1148095.1 M23 family metallopeptidase [Chloroflexota bacterium]MQC82321.1 M23 family peptidase [Chloroflexota bacterium]